jgi:hypothetical protein
MQSTTNNEKLNELFKAIERRVTVTPEVFHTVIQVLKNDPALKALGEKMNGYYIAICGTTRVNFSQSFHPPSICVTAPKAAESETTVSSTEPGHHTSIPHSLAEVHRPGDFQQSKLSVNASMPASIVKVAKSIDEIKQMIEALKKYFDELKKDIRSCLIKRRIAVQEVADALTSLSVDDDENDKKYLKDNLSVMFRAKDHFELFGWLNFHWDYLNYPLLDHLIRKFNLEVVKAQMDQYKCEVELFRKRTPLDLYCKTHKKKRIDPPPQNFVKVVVEFHWPEKREIVTMEDVEQFRQEYASHYKLHECAIRVADIRYGSLIVTWFIPECLVEKLKTNVPEQIFSKYFVTRLEIVSCVFVSNVSMIAYWLQNVYSFHIESRSHRLPATVHILAQYYFIPQNQHYLCQGI